MLAQFPRPYPEEDFRSIIYRYHIRSGKLLFEETNKELFKVSSKRNIYFHHNISEMVHLLNNMVYTIEDFLNDHTIFPLIKSFLPDEREKDFIKGLLIKDTLKNKKIFQDYISNEIKYCPKCLEEDDKKYGEVYAHRLHQINFLNYCYKHHTNLISICQDCGEALSKNYGKNLLTRPFCENGHSLTLNNSFNNECPQLIKKILQDIHFIISNSSEINKNFVIDLIYSRLGKLGYSEIYSELIQMKRLRKDFSEFISNHLQILGVQHHNIINSRFHILLSKKSNDAPNILAYLLLIQFIFNSADELFSQKVGFSIDIPFINKPYPCLNKICKYYDKPIIITYNKKHYPAYVQGTFTCPYCGYTYGHKWIWNKDKQSGEIKKPFIISRGKLWEEKVISLYNKGISLKEIADRMGLGRYTNPIAKFLKEKLGKGYSKRFNPQNSYSLYNINSRLEHTSSNYEDVINELKMGINEVAATNYHQQLIFLRRQNIVNIIEKNPTITRKHIEELARTDYRWLKKNDSEWFNEVLPKPFARKNKS